MRKYISLDWLVEHYFAEDVDFYGKYVREDLLSEKTPTIEVREDAISREDAIKALRLEYPSISLFREMREGWHLKTEGYRKAEEIIKNASSVVPNRNCGAKMKGMDDEIIVTDMSSEELELALDFAERVWGLSREETIEAIKKGDYVFRLEK